MHDKMRLIVRAKGTLGTSNSVTIFLKLSLREDVAYRRIELEA